MKRAIWLVSAALGAACSGGPGLPSAQLDADAGPNARSSETETSGLAPDSGVSGPQGSAQPQDTLDVSSVEETTSAEPRPDAGTVSEPDTDSETDTATDTDTGTLSGPEPDAGAWPDTATAPWPDQTSDESSPDAGPDDTSTDETSDETTEPPSEPSIPAMIETFEPGSNGLTPESFLDWSVWGLRFNAQTLSWASMASGYAAHATADGILPDGYVYTGVTVGGNAAAPLAGAADYAGVGFHACASVPLLLAIYTQHPTEASEAILYDTPVALTHEWQAHFVTWDEFSSGGYDWRRDQVTSAGSFDPSLFRGLYLGSHEGQTDYELWIDNVQFITTDQDTLQGTAPSGPCELTD